MSVCDLVSIAYATINFYLIGQWFSTTIPLFACFIILQSSARHCHAGAREPMPRIMCKFITIRLNLTFLLNRVRVSAGDSSYIRSIYHGDGHIVGDFYCSDRKSFCSRFRCCSGQSFLVIDWWNRLCEDYRSRQVQSSSPLNDRQAVILPDRSTEVGCQG